MNTEIFKQMSNADINTIIDGSQPFVKLMTYYGCALREVETKLQVLNDEFKLTHDRNPIESIKSRIKTPQSIVDKLERRGIEANVSNPEEYIRTIERELFDIAGIRVICAFPDDIYKLAEQLISQDDITLIRTKDYILSPKPNGYRSLHLIVEVPVFFSSGKRNMKVEVQLRTMAMDFWASLEHKIYYKFEGNAPEYISRDLRECAGIVGQLDAKMLSLNEAILEAKEKQEHEREEKIREDEHH